MNKTITRNGITYTVLPDGGWLPGQESWYISHPIRNGSRLEIARVGAMDGRKYPTEEEMRALNVSRYASSQDYMGKPVTMMIGLAAEEIAEYGFTPTGKNPTGRRVSTPAEAQAAVDRLCNEE